MRIFYAAPTTAHQSHLPTSRLWEYNLYWPLIDLGHEVVVFDFDYTEFNYHLDPASPKDREFITIHRPRFGAELLKQVKVAHAQRPLDLFFSYFYSSYVEPEVIREIGRLGMTTVNWYCNASYQFHLVADIAPAYDYCLVPEKFRLEDYRRIGASPIYCQEAANPNIYRHYPVPLEFDITFVGQRYGDRPTYLRKLLQAGLDVRAWGPHWQEPTPLWRRSARSLKQGLRGHNPWRVFANDFPLERCGPPLSDDELIKMYSRSRISLGFSSVAEWPTPGQSPIKQVRLRDFEAPMSGAFYMVEAYDELREFFEPNKEIVFFANAEELIDKTRYYLAHDAERERIRQAGMKRARTEHSWHERFRMVFREIGWG